MISTTMNTKFLHSFGSKSSTARAGLSRFAATLLVLGLAACGGGGGTTPPTGFTQTVTCPNGTSKTGNGATASAALDVATAQCAAPALILTTPSNGTTGVAPEAFAGVIVATDSVLDPSSLTTSTVTLKAGAASVVGTVVADGTKGFKLIPSGNLLYAQVYTFLATVKDALGKPLVVRVVFATASVSCLAPQVLNASGTACEAPPVTAWWPPSTFVPMGVKVYLNSETAPVGAVTNATYPGQIESGLLPSACKITGDACWQEAVRNGTIKFIVTGAVEAANPGKAIVFGFYKTISTISFPGENKVLYCNKHFYAVDGTYTADAVEQDCSQAEAVAFVGSPSGGMGWHIISGLNVCSEKSFDPSQNRWIETQIACP